MAFTQSESTPMTSINCSSESEWIFENGVYDDLPVKDFVHTVLDLSNEEIDAILEYKFKANVIALFEYKQGIETGKYEMELYKPFVTVANDLLASYLAQNCPDQKPSIRLYERHLSRTHTNSRVRRSVAPDVISLWTSSDDPNDMAAIQIPFEFQTQKRRRLAPVDVEDPFINGPISDSRFAAPKNSKPRPSSRRLIKSVQYLVSDSRLRMSDRAKASPALQEMTISSKTSHSSSNVNDKKRKRSIDDVGGRDTLNQNEAQLASYALKCFESTSRLFVAGVYVQHWTMALWYYDRMGAARTVSFQFSFDDVQMLGLVLVALNRSDVTNAGISPFLHTIGPQDPADLLCSTTSERFLAPPSVSLSTLSLASKKLPPKGRKGSILRFPCSIADREGNQSTEYRAFVIEAILFRYPRLLGRGTEVYLVHELLEAGLKASEDLVAKLAWCSVHRPPESATLRTLLANAPELSRHLPNVAFACVYDSDKHLCLPRYKLLSSDEWAKTDITGVDFEKRDLVVIVMKRYQPLWSVRNLDEFKKVFLDLVECHHRAYKKGGYLHRDISETNLMVDRSDDGTVTGVLCDWDLSSAVDDDGVVISSNATHRTGTYPFLATELLTDKPPVHLYRHDLESFFYILIWAGLHYSFSDEGAKYLVKDEVKIWMDAEHHGQAQDNKLAMITGVGSIANRVFQQFHPDFQPLVEQWVIPLWQFFRSAFLKADTSVPSFGFDTAIASEFLTFENFMEALGEKPRQWDDFSTSFEPCA